MGQGPSTGRGLGYCSGSDSPGYAKRTGGGLGRLSGRGMGRGPGWVSGMGRGRGYARNFGFCGVNQEVTPGYHWNSMSREAEVMFLKSQAEGLNHSLKEVEKRLADLQEED